MQNWFFPPLSVLSELHLDEVPLPTESVNGLHNVLREWGGATNIAEDIFLEVIVVEV